MADEWVTVGSRGRSKRDRAGSGQAGGGAHSKQQRHHPQHQPGSSQPPTPAQLARWCTLVADARREVEGSAFFRGLRPVLAEAALPLAPAAGPSALLACTRQMVIWGLGSLESPLVHIRYQLALAQLLQALLAEADDAGEAGGGGHAADAGGAAAGTIAAAQCPVEAYDPVFSALDRAVLAACGIQVTPTNPEGRHVAAVPTLVYLPHCELELTEQLLAANVAAGSLANLAILGNSFGQYRERYEVLGGYGWKKDPPPAAQQQQGGQRQRGNGGGAALGSAQLQRESEEGGAAALERPEGLLCDLCRCGAVEERAVGERGFPVTSAFNDMSLHTFTGDWRERLARQRAQ